MKKLLSLICILCLSSMVISSCHDDGEDTILITVSIRVDLNVPEYATVFNQTVKLNNDDTWKVTLENFRTHEFRVKKPKDGVPKNIPTVTRTNDPILKEIFSLIPSKYNPQKNEFKVESEITDHYATFVVSP